MDFKTLNYRHMKVFIITQSEPFFVPKMIHYLYEDSQKEQFEIVGITVLKPFRKNKSFSHWFKERARIYNFKELILVGSAFLFSKITTKLKKASNYSISSICEKNKISIYNYNDINNEHFIDLIKKLNVDILISISSPQLFKKELLSTPKVACINAHGTLLPRHRGVFGSWWMLYSGDKVGGSTIHTMVEEVDRGDIIWQKEFEITSTHTQYSIAYQTKKDMAIGLAEVIRKYSSGEIKPLFPKYESSYHYAPDKHLGKEFHKRNKKVLVMNDLKHMLSSKF